MAQTRRASSKRHVLLRWSGALGRRWLQDAGDQDVLGAAAAISLAAPPRIGAPELRANDVRHAALRAREPRGRRGRPGRSVAVVLMLRRVVPTLRVVVLAPGRQTQDGDGGIPARVSEKRTHVLGRVHAGRVGLVDGDQDRPGGLAMAEL